MLNLCVQCPLAPTACTVCMHERMMLKSNCLNTDFGKVHVISRYNQSIRDAQGHQKWKTIKSVQPIGSIGIGIAQDPLRDRTNMIKQVPQQSCRIATQALPVWFKSEVLSNHKTSAGMQGTAGPVAILAHAWLFSKLKSKVRTISGHLCLTSSFHPMEDIESCDEGSSVVPRSCKSRLQHAEASGKQLWSAKTYMYCHDFHWFVMKLWMPPRQMFLRHLRHAPNVHRPDQDVPKSECMPSIFAKLSLQSLYSSKRLSGMQLAKSAGLLQTVCKRHVWLMYVSCM